MASAAGAASAAGSAAGGGGGAFVVEGPLPPALSAMPREDTSTRFAVWFVYGDGTGWNRSDGTGWNRLDGTGWNR